MSPELTVRLRKLTVAAADRGWITLTPEQGLLAFDTASALVGLTIPVTTGVEETSCTPRSNSRDASACICRNAAAGHLPVLCLDPRVGRFLVEWFCASGIFCAGCEYLCLGSSSSWLQRPFRHYRSRPYSPSVSESDR